MHDACLAIANIVFAYAGHVAFFTMFSELQDINDFPRALALLQITEMVLYTITAIVIYAYMGPSVTSPALNPAGKLFRKISYGIAIPTVCVVEFMRGSFILHATLLTWVKIVIGGVVNAHVGVKYIYVHMLRGTKAMYSKSMASRAKWAAIGLVLWIISWIIAEAIPVFNDVLGLAVRIHPSGSISRGNLSLTDRTELAVCQLVHVRSAGDVLAYINRHRWFMDRNQMFFFCINVGLVFLGAIIVSYTILGLQSSETDFRGSARSACIHRFGPSSTI